MIEVNYLFLKIFDKNFFTELETVSFRLVLKSNKASTHYNTAE
jgi:hypothetical protein